MNEADTALKQNQDTETTSLSFFQKVRQKADGFAAHLNTRFVNPINPNDIFKGYNLSQLCYFAAFAVLLLQSIWAEEINLLIVGLIGLVGLIRELTRLFEFIWSFTLGKSFILVLYAGTANMSLAFAAMQINMITGVEPTPFVFTLGFTSIVLLPFWIAVASMVFFTISLAIANFWLLIRLPLKLIGLKTAIHWEDRRSPFLTMILRIVLIPIVLVSMFETASPYFSATLDDFSDAVFVNNRGGIELSRDKMTDPTEIMQTMDVSEEEAKIIADTVAQELAKQDTEDSEEPFITVSSSLDEEEGEEENENTVRKSIAFFLFHFESYPNSMCQKEDNERSVIIDENMVLLISKNSTQEYGYDFRVVKCKPAT